MEANGEQNTSARRHMTRSGVEAARQERSRTLVNDTREKDGRAQVQAMQDEKAAVGGLCMHTGLQAGAAGWLTMS